MILNSKIIGADEKKIMQMILQNFKMFQLRKSMHPACKGYKNSQITKCKMTANSQK